MYLYESHSSCYYRSRCDFRKGAHQCFHQCLRCWSQVKMYSAELQEGSILDLNILHRPDPSKVSLRPKWMVPGASYLKHEALPVTPLHVGLDPGNPGLVTLPKAFLVGCFTGPREWNPDI
ncbi:hypothetical protein AB205_0011000 [Aquarana catesbeiana]|uniref:Uncharacterized protein n=1 Tax=Aquarana catesbeiana TaxID=8400 RepID=A0A2G9SAR8_AQUCT|nr:hypothetical protein AB205_0011000 [Aquarana catesbeiana]